MADSPVKAGDNPNAPSDTKSKTPAQSRNPELPFSEKNGDSPF
jgi:hypothetical protein